MAIWNKSHVYTASQTCTNLDAPAKLYTCAVGGTSASTGVGPTGTGSGITDGGVTWNYTSMAPVLQTSIASVWKLDGNSNDAITGAASTNTAITWNPCKISVGASFNGSTSTIQTTIPGPSGANTRTISCWCYPLDARTSNVWAYGPDVLGQKFDIYYTGTVMYLDVYGTAYQIGIPTLSAWHHVVVTYDGTTLGLYLDNVLTNSVTLTLATVAPPNFSMGTGFYGSIDDVRLWNRALSTEEVGILNLAGQLSRID